MYVKILKNRAVFNCHVSYFIKAKIVLTIIMHNESFLHALKCAIQQVGVD